MIFHHPVIQGPTNEEGTAREGTARRAPTPTSLPATPQQSLQPHHVLHKGFGGFGLESPRSELDKEGVVGV